MEFKLTYLIQVIKTCTYDERKDVNMSACVLNWNEMWPSIFQNYIMLNEMMIPLVGCNYSYADAILVDLIKPVANYWINFCSKTMWQNGMEGSFKARSLLFFHGLSLLNPISCGTKCFQAINTRTDLVSLPPNGYFWKHIIALFDIISSHGKMRRKLFHSKEFYSFPLFQHWYNGSEHSQHQIKRLSKQTHRP